MYKVLSIIVSFFIGFFLKGEPNHLYIPKYDENQPDSIRLANIYEIVDDYYDKDEVLFFKYLKEYEQLSIKLKSDRDLASVYRRYANYYNKEQYYEKALMYSTKALKLDLQDDYKLGITSDYISIANVYTTQGNYRQSLKLFNKVLSYYENERSNKFPHGVGNIQLHMADVYFKKKAFKKALVTIDLSIKNLKKSGNYQPFFDQDKIRAPLLTKAYLVKAKVLLKLNMTDQIPLVLETVFQLLDKWKFHHERIEYNFIKTNYDFNKDGYVNVEKIKSLLHEAKGEELNTYIINYYSLLKVHAENTGDYKMALKYSDSIAKFQSKIHQIKSTDAKNKYLAQFETEKAKYETKEAKLETENQIQKVWIISGLFIVTLVFLILIFINLETKKKSHKQAMSLKDLKIDELLRENELENLQGLLAGQEVERKRIAQDLHDTIGGMLSTIKLHFNALRKSMGLKAEDSEIFTNADNLLDESCKELRRVSHDLNTGSLASYGLKENLKTLKNALELTSEVTVNLIFDELELPSSSKIEQELFKVIQELLSNTLKHAQATEINIQLSQFDDEIQLIFEDNGIGFNVNKITRGLGLDSIQKRIAKLQGTLTIDSHERSGTTFIFEIPVKS